MLYTARMDLLESVQRHIQEVALRTVGSKPTPDQQRAMRDSKRYMPHGVTPDFHATPKGLIVMSWPKASGFGVLSMISISREPVYQSTAHNLRDLTHIVSQIIKSYKGHTLSKFIDKHGGSSTERGVGGQSAGAEAPAGAKNKTPSPRLSSDQMKAFMRARAVIGNTLTKGTDVRVPQTPDGLDIVTWMLDGNLMAIAFKGKAGKPFFYVNYGSDTPSHARRRDKAVQSTIDGYVENLKRKETAREERKNVQNPYKVGDILYSSWGYDQTNIDYYKVLKVMPKSVKIQKINLSVSSSNGPNDSVVPSTGFAHGSKPMTKRVQNAEGYVRLTSYSGAHPWDGKPKHKTGAGYGH